MRRRLAAALLVVPASFSACSDADAPNAANFGKAITPLVANSYCKGLNPSRMALEGQPEGSTFPIYLADSASPFDPGRSDREVLEGAAGMKLLKRTVLNAVAKPAGGSGPMTRQTLVRFDPTDKAGSHVRIIRAMTVGGEERDVAALCAARGELVGIERWTEPADASGRRVTQVTYSERAVDPIDGLSLAERGKLSEVREKTVPLVLMSDGWQVLRH